MFHKNGIGMDATFATDDKHWAGGVSLDVIDHNALNRLRSPVHSELLAVSNISARGCPCRIFFGLDGQNAKQKNGGQMRFHDTPRDVRYVLNWKRLIKSLFCNDVCRQGIN